MGLTFHTQYTGGQLPNTQMAEKLMSAAVRAHLDLENGTGQGAGMRGWLKFPTEYQKDDEYSKIKSAAKTIIANAEVLLVIGIGGSYLGARAVIEAVTSRYYNELRDGTPAIYFTGNTLSESDYADLDRLIEGKDFYINVISKSGKTLESAVAFRHYKAKLAEKWNNADEVNRRIFVTTDANKGTLLEEARGNTWPAFVVPTDIGGR